MLLLLCLAYVIAGFVGREPWKNADITAFGIMLGMANGSVEWLWPSVLDAPAENAALLPYWLGAWSVTIFPFHPELASRVPFACALGATLYFTWQSAFRLALLPQAQPVVFAFGGEAKPVDYARAMADGALLALMACLGLAQLSHEITPDAFRLTCMSVVLYGATILFNSASTQSIRPRGLVAWVLGLVMLGLSGGAMLAVLFSLAVPVVHMFSMNTEHRGAFWRRIPQWHGVAWVVGLVLSLALVQWEPTRTALSRGADLLNPSLWVTFGQLLLWFTWPTWPLAVWTLWRWRRHIRDHHIAVPLLFIIVLGLVSVLDGASDRRLLGALPAMAILAAFALPTLRRSVAAFLDWFSVLFFSVCSLTVWLLWVAMLTGFPAKPAANVARLAPGFVAEFSATSFLPALITTGIWLLVVRWRLGRHQPAMWKSLVLPATGGTLCWVLLMTLWLPLLDFGRSYGPISRRIAQMIPQGSCTDVLGLTHPQISGLAYHGGLTLMSAARDSECQTMIVHPAAAPTLGDAVDLTQWAFVARLSRLTDNKESLLLYQRVASAHPTPFMATRPEAERGRTENAR